MTELHQYLGSVLRDITQARVTSDAYSRDASRFYKQDPILRRFPVPRVDIGEVEVDLKFAVADVEPDENPQLRTVKIERVFDRFGEPLIQKSLDALILCLEDNPKLSSESVEMQNLMAKLNAQTYRDDLTERVTRFLKENRDSLVTQEIQFEHQKAREGIEKIFAKVLYQEPAMVELFRAGAGTNMEETVRSSVSRVLNHVLRNEMRPAVRFLRESNQDYKVEVEVEVDRLIQKPPEMLSCIKFKAVIRNYIWSKTDSKDAKVTRQLIPE